MTFRLIRWLLRRREHKGQGLVEFAIAIPVFLLFIFGIIQAVLVYKAYLAVNQAATDATHVLAAQSSDGSKDNLAINADARGLAALRGALASQDLNSVVSVDVASVDQAGIVKTLPITNSNLLVNGPFTTANAPNITLDNRYTISPPGSGQTNCQVDQFYLANALNPITVGANPYWKPCAQPWDGSPWDGLGNLNGRHDIRCTEDTIKVTVVYHYVSINAFGVHYDLTLTGQDSTTLEPRAFLGNAGTQNAIGGCNF